MEKLLETLMRYKIAMILLLVILLGGLAFLMGHSSATTQTNETQVVKQVENVSDKKDSSKNETSQSADEALKKSEEKANADIKKMEKAIEENNKRIEEDEQYGKTINGTDIPAPPKFSKSTVPTRKADFQN